jgi:hypothetical protein
MQNALITIAVLMSAQVLAQESNTHFSHTVETTASPAGIWRIWTDVPNWKSWDDGLKSAELNGPFAAGTTGTLIPDKGPKSRFVLTEVIDEQSYTVKTKLPLGALYVKRYLSVRDGKTIFTHDVWFRGVTKGIFGRALGRNYRRILPEVMGKIKTLAES